MLSLAGPRDEALTALMLSLRLIRRLVFSSLLLVPAAQAGDPRLAQVDAIFGAWLDDHQAQGVAAVFDGGALLGHAEHGISKDAAIEIASLSKAITALCAHRLVAEGRLSWSDDVADHLGQGPSVTLAELVTHTGGLTPDSTQYGMPVWLDDPKLRGQDVLGLIAVRDGYRGPRGAFSYNNENYALLGLAIQVASDAPYFETCHDLVLEPAGAKGWLAPRSGAFASWGGWAMPVAEFGRAMAHWFGPGADLARDPFAAPVFNISGTLHYGLGTYVRPSGEGYNFWHFGGLCFPKRFETASFWVTSDQGWSLVLAYDRCLSNEAVLALQNDLVRMMQETSK